MNAWKPVACAVLLASSGCAARPAYFGSAARVVQENGAAYWEAPVLSPAYLQARMRRPRRAGPLEATAYQGTLSLRSVSPAVLRSSFTVVEGSSATFHYQLMTRSAPVRYDPGALDVVVACGRGQCRASSRPAPIREDGTVFLKKMPRRRPDKRAASRKAADAGALAAARALRKDGECADLDQAVASARTRLARAGGSETRAELEARDRFIEGGCEAWLDARGGAGAARRRVRLSQWTSLGGE